MAQPEAGIVRPDRDDAYYVADLAVTCSPYQRGERFVRDPILIVEILSPSTERHDRRTKLPVYRDIESVKRSCSSTRKASTPKILRRDGDRWITELVQDREAMIRLSSVDLPVAMAEPYEGIDFDADDAA
jgi:Uma2 family endonuclease